MATASVDAISDRFDIVKGLIDGSWDHEQDNLDIATSDAGLPSAICIGHFCSVDSRPGPQGPLDHKVRQGQKENKAKRVTKEKQERQVHPGQLGFKDLKV